MCQNISEGIASLLDKGAGNSLDKIAVFDRNQKRTYHELKQRSLQFARYFFYVKKVLPQNRVLIYLPNEMAAIESIFGCAYAGLTFSVLNAETKPFHLNHIVQDSGALLLVTTEILKKNLPEDLRQEIEVVTIKEIETFLNRNPNFEKDNLYSGRKEDIGTIIYTSGSTGFPKGIVSKNENILFATHAIQQVLQYRNTDVVMVVLPLSFDYGLYQLFLAFSVGATVALGDEDIAGPLILKRMVDWSVSCMPLVPGLMDAILKMAKRPGVQLPNLRLITNTGAHMPSNKVQEFKTLFPYCSVFLMYGLTECKRVSILLPEELEFKINSVGRPIPGTECFVVDENGMELQPGEKGELVVSGNHVMSGYLNNARLTKQKFRTIRGKRCLFTGDYGVVDEEGFIYFHGRNDDIFKRKGFRVSTLEIERAALSVPGICNASAIFKEAANNLVLFVESAEEISQEAIINQLKNMLEPHKIPDALHIVPKIPKTINGKNNKEDLQKQILNEQQG